MYSISAYGSMIADGARMDAYVEALRRAVKPGSVVLDIGAGTGIFSLLACRFGAGRVYAVEPDDAIQVAREIAEANGYSDRIEFIQKLSTEITLPEPADVMICDLRGLLPLFGHHIPSVIDARERLLKPGGVQIPQSDQLRVAVIEAEELCREHFSPWDLYDFDTTAAKRIIANTCGWKLKDLEAGIMLTEPELWARLDYTKIEDPNVEGAVRFNAIRTGRAHGLLVWFDSVLAENVRFSNAPGSSNPTKVYGRSFFPWTDPVDLTAGDEVEVKLEARFVASDYLYRWQTVIRDGQNPQQIRAHFNQSTFFGEPLSLGRLRKQSAEFVPELSRDGLIDQFILTQMADHKPLGEIAKQVIEQFPGVYRRWEDALTHIGELSKRYSH